MNMLSRAKRTAARELRGASVSDHHHYRFTTSLWGFFHVQNTLALSLPRVPSLSSLLSCCPEVLAPGARVRCLPVCLELLSFHLM
jgi:hypothetical protein